MLTRATGFLSAAICSVGLLAAANAGADDHRNDRHFGDSRHYHHSRHRGHDDARYDRRASSYRAYRRHDHGRHRNTRYYVRSERPYWNYRCGDRRHYGYSHFHVPVRYYSRSAYARYPYHGVYRGHGAGATVILSFPL